MKLSDLRDALLEVIPDVFHYEAKGKPDKYIVWAEDGEADSLEADDQKMNKLLKEQLITLQRLNMTLMLKLSNRN